MTSFWVEWSSGQTRHFATPRQRRPAKGDSRLEYLLDAPWAADTHTHVHMQQEHTSAPQIVDLDPDGHTLSTSVLLTAQSVANLPLTSFPSPLTNAPLLTQKCASYRAQPPSPIFNLSPITDPTFLSLNPTASTASSSSPTSQLHASSHRVPDPAAADSVHKGLRPKASYHHSLLNLRDEIFRPSDSGAYHFRDPPWGFVY
jgi:hypothetical protein